MVPKLQSKRAVCAGIALLTSLFFLNHITERKIIRLWNNDVNSSRLGRGYFARKFMTTSAHPTTTTPEASYSEMPSHRKLVRKLSTNEKKRLFPKMRSFILKLFGVSPPAKAPVAPPVRPPTPVVSPPTRAPVIPDPIAVGTDLVKPKLLNMSIFHPLLDVSNGTALAVIQFTVQDENSGIRRCLVSVTGDDWLYNSFDEYVPPINTGSRIVTFNLTLQFRRLIRQGKYKLSVLLSDNAYNSADFYYPSLVAQGYPSSIQVINSNQDTSPPKVVRFVAMTPTSVNVSQSAGTVSYQVELEDTGFGIKSATIFASGDGRRIEAYQGLNQPVVGRFTFTLNVTVPAFSKPGNYTLQLFVSDSNQNENRIESSQLAQLGFPFRIEVVDATPDVTPPQLLTFVTTMPLVVNTTAGDNRIMFSLTALDDMSGLWGCRVFATFDTNKTISDGPRFLPFPIKEVFGFTATFLNFGSSSWKGVYKLSIRLLDDEDNGVTIGSEELVARGFPGAFTVV